MPDDAVVLDESYIRDRMERTVIPVCVECIHWDVGEETCNAFSRAIPDDIFIFGNPHTNPFPGDGGIRFEPIEEEEE